MKLIDKSALVAEIERRETNIKEYCFREGHDTRFDVVPEQLSQILSFINTLETKEVDLEKEVKEEYLNRRCYVGKDNMLVILNEPQFNDIAKHFFELGLNAQRKIGYVPNIDDSLKELGVDPSSKEAKIFKESYCAALDKFMAQKGE